jgi:vacuolar-type H+-ATPase subunit D/Vma8
MIAPNKQNLILLKGQKKLLKNGYKLLKEKRTGLIVTFLEMANEGKSLELELREYLEIVVTNYRIATRFMSGDSISHSFQTSPKYLLEISRKRISGVFVTFLNINMQPLASSNLKPTLLASFTNFNNLFPKLVLLGQKKINILRVAEEIKKTSRQIINLERKIEDTEADLKYVKMMLMEKDNFEKATLIKIFK